MLAHIFVEKAHNVLGDRERARRCGRRRVQDMDDVADALNAEIVHENDYTQMTWLLPPGNVEGSHLLWFMEDSLAL